MTNFTLRQITDALAQVDPGFDSAEKARKSYYDRAKMLRDRKLIRSSLKTQQGRTTELNEADTIAAIFAICANRDGESWSIIEHAHLALRQFDSTTGRRAFEEYAETIASGTPVFIDIHIVRYPFPGIDVQMSSKPAPAPENVTRTITYPITALALPVMQNLAETAEE
ncbi:hypothetical protein L0664_04460 [Octadecabacter sp. G9-8]|uniref:Uncharacterized protein n=1 Tax=Octadecabacter dasysiphoniae TaxID=2909341 RepID=A0ABS9CTN6_9RHOB|nr:hypothetical protein [Octadecabacter dasysiphoniae]MCF2870311.1 hypothetical protein [Octadecabacter dasysiphoniae]